MITIPDPYFKNIPEIGDLKMEYVILEYDYPLLFVCKNDGGNLYLCSCSDVIGEQRWLIVPISKSSLVDLLTNKLMLRAVFTQAKGTCCIATWSKQSQREKFNLVTAKEFDITDLPIDGAYLDAEEEEYSDFINLLREGCK